MSLSDRLKQVADKGTFEDRVKTDTGDPLADYKQHAREALFARLAPGAFDMSVDQAELERAVRSELTKLISQDGVPLSADERDRIAAEICEDLLGYGPIQRFLDDPTVTEIMVNSNASIYVEREGRLARTKYRFVSEGHVRRVIDRIVALIGRRIDEASLPIVVPLGHRRLDLIHIGPAVPLRDCSQRREVAPAFRDASPSSCSATSLGCNIGLSQRCSHQFLPKRPATYTTANTTTR